MEALTAAGLFGRSTSKSTMLPALLPLVYKGHVLLGDEKTAMEDYVPSVPERELELPVVLLIGTSMSAGKTTSAKVIVRLLKGAGLAVIGATRGTREAAQGGEDLSLGEGVWLGRRDPWTMATTG